jgi:hypothetical protein
VPAVPRQVEAGSTTTLRGAMAQDHATESLDPAVGLGRPAGRPSRWICWSLRGDDRAGGLSLGDAVERRGGKVSVPRRLGCDGSRMTPPTRQGRTGPLAGRSVDPVEQVTLGRGDARSHGGGAISKAVRVGGAEETHGLPSAGPGSPPARCGGDQVAYDSRRSPRLADRLSPG